jgi:hypothetical protein
MEWIDYAVLCRVVIVMVYRSIHTVFHQICLSRLSRKFDSQIPILSN